MKRSIHIFLTITVLLILSAGLAPVSAQQPPIPPPQHSIKGNSQPGTGNCSAPIREGIGILIAFGVAYGLRKMRFPKTEKLGKPEE